MRRLKKEIWPYMITFKDSKKVEEVELWMGEKLGAFKGRWNVIYFYEHYDFYFKDAKDRTMFILRWL